MQKLLCLTLVIAGCDTSSRHAPEASPLPSTAASNDPVTLMHAAMQLRDWQTADRFSQQVLIAFPNDADLVTDAAKVAAFCGRKRDAAFLLVDAASVAEYEPAARVNFAVQALIDVGELYAAIDLLEESLTRHPDRSGQRRTLVGFLGEAHLIHRIPEHFLELIRSREFDFPLLVSLTETSFRRFSDQTVQMLLQRNPSDHRVKLGRARELFDKYEVAEAGAVLSDILEHHNAFGPAHALLGQVLVQQQRFDELQHWRKTACQDSNQFPDYWLTIGDLAEQSADYHLAIRAYWESTRRDPNQPVIWTRMLQALKQLDNQSGESVLTESQTKDIEQRIADLLELRARFYRFSANKRSNQSDAIDVAESLVKLGRYWEAEAWTAAATGLTQERSSRLTPLRESIIDTLKLDSSWLVTRGHPALSLELSRLPLPDHSNGEGVIARHDLVPTAPDLASCLVEVTAQWGLAGVAEQTNPGDPRLASVIRSTGAGGGAIDFDMDGRCDILVMGAGGSIGQQDSSPNELLRNLGGGFIRVTEFSGVGDRGFGQGVAVGDFNEDGFPDLFFANLGANRLLRNNGDGTFADCSKQLQDGEIERWSTSAAFVDLNVDGITDLFVTNYCKLVKGIDEPCNDASGNPGPCHPLFFPADYDNWYMAIGDGRFADSTAIMPAPPSPRRGLGIVAGALDGSRLSAFVANDISANDFYSKDTDSANGWSESAVARGVAVDERTLTQGSMGVAASDFDADGDLDLYVTGFSQEYNIFYEQVVPGFWRDSTARLGMVEPTLNMVGFGTQAIDLNSDGFDEIIVANGHIGQFSDPKEPPYEQPLQVFCRISSGAFELVDVSGWGDYFAERHSGRALWTMDANSDGRNDVVLTNTKEQIALLINAPQPETSVIGLRLVGARSSRDAIGALVQFNSNGNKRTLWALSGNGYLCASEGELRAGLGQAKEITEVTVTWPDGSIERLGSLRADAEYLLIQGDQAPFVLRHYSDLK